MRRINDGFNNVAHLHDLDPRYDRENDDVRDRVEFGEAPQREWIPRGTRIRSASTPPKGTWQADRSVFRKLYHNARSATSPTLSNTWYRMMYPPPAIRRGK